MPPHTMEPIKGHRLTGPPGHRRREAEGYIELACAMIETAARLWRRRNRIQKIERREVEAFFRSAWFDELCHHLNLNPAEIRAELNIPVGATGRSPRETK